MAKKGQKIDHVAAWSPQNKILREIERLQEIASQAERR